MQLDSKTKWSLKLLAENLSEPTVSEPFSFFGPPPQQSSSTSNLSSDWFSHHLDFP